VESSCDTWRLWRILARSNARHLLVSPVLVSAHVGLFGSPSVTAHHAREPVAFHASSASPSAQERELLTSRPSRRRNRGNWPSHSSLWTTGALIHNSDIRCNTSSAMLWFRVIGLCQLSLIVVKASQTTSHFTPPSLVRCIQSAWESNSIYVHGWHCKFSYHTVLSTVIAGVTRELSRMSSTGKIFASKDVQHSTHCLQVSLQFRTWYLELWHSCRQHGHWSQLHIDCCRACRFLSLASCWKSAAHSRRKSKASLLH
jgi:hypothetical protein